MRVGLTLALVRKNLAFERHVIHPIKPLTTDNKGNIVGTGINKGASAPSMFMFGIDNLPQSISPRSLSAVSNSSTSTSTGLPALSRWISGCSGAS